MIKEIHSFDSYEDFINDFFGNPVFADPHLEFDHGNLYRSLNKNDRKVFVVTKDETVKGLFVWLILPDDHYIEMLIGLSKEAAPIQEMLAYMEDSYRGYQLDFVINPQHPVFCDLLQSKHAKFDAEQQWMVWEKEVENQYPYEIVLLSPEYEAQYKEKHSIDTYWTAEKVLNAKDRFRVFLAIHEGQVVGYLDVTHCYEKNEPYALWVDDAFQDQGYAQALLLAAIHMNKPNKMMVLVDVHHFDEIEMLQSIGFVPAVGTNSVYATYQA